MQGPAVHEDVPEHPGQVARRLPPDAVQLQVILGSLLGDGRLEGPAGERRLRIAHRAERADYVRWKYERLGALVAAPPETRNGLLGFTTVAHPLFDDLAVRLSLGQCPSHAPNRPRREALALLTPLGLAVWLTDLGRLELRADAFLPTQRTAVLAR